MSLYIWKDTVVKTLIYRWLHFMMLHDVTSTWRPNEKINQTGGASRKIAQELCNVATFVWQGYPTWREGARVTLPAF